ncbi:hypothetical protein CAPTEDRAFT_207656 [Capitella teleta]|uniref:Uncharacterized protein n=1 Tax=Capitella teleta TaxID=283909 RepID=R7UUM5_CAPTE|nr:hypothetical protein CAPTEDRAFT_207656 [Capitella teleta]|eukprot:ELU09873.1 hypothetical protein CAPTEDRAFT_207656 [Capitella teleta]
MGCHVHRVFFKAALNFFFRSSREAFSKSLLFSFSASHDCEATHPRPIECKMDALPVIESQIEIDIAELQSSIAWVEEQLRQRLMTMEDCFPDVPAELELEFQDYWMILDDLKSCLLEQQEALANRDALFTEFDRQC